MANKLNQSINKMKMIEEDVEHQFLDSLCMLGCVCPHIYVHIHTQKGRERERERENPMNSR